MITSTITVIGGFVAARLLSRRHTKATRALDFMLLAAVVLPSVVFGAFRGGGTSTPSTWTAMAG